MKRRKICAQLLAIVVGILLFILTIKFNSTLDIRAILPIVLVYISLSSSISTSCLEIISDRKAKEPWYGLLFYVDGIIMITDFMIAYGNTDNISEFIRTIMLIVFVITFLLFVVLYALLSKAEKSK